jgi:hypothetical protein
VEKIELPLFTNLVNLRMARHSAVAESSVYRLLGIGTYIAQTESRMSRKTACVTPNVNCRGG